MLHYVTDEAPSSTVLKMGNIQILTNVGVVQKVRSVIPSFQVCDSFLVLVFRSH